MTIRGIANPATACHVSCAILLLAYAMSPLAQLIIAAAPLHPESALLRTLAALLKELLVEGPSPNNTDADERHGDETGADPSEFYARLQKDVGIQVHDLGDAVTSLTKLFAVLRDEPVLADCMDSALYSGMGASVIVGDYMVSDDAIQRRRRKWTKTKALPVPFPILVNHAVSTSSDNANCISFQEALQRRLEPNPLHGYTWSGDFHEDTIPLPQVSTNDTGVQGWRTTKQLQLQRLAPFWLIHVDNFSQMREIEESNRHRPFTIPLSLDTEKDVGIELGEPQQYQLSGAVLHVELDVDKEDEENGHYVTLVRTQQRDWTLINDDQTKTMSEDDAMELLGGRQSDVVERESFLRTVLVVYESPEANRNLEDREKIIREQVAEVIHRGESMVGRRLRVLWSRNKYYAGVVSSFDLETGKHVVRYDDGDVRVYNLSKKTVEWLDNES